MTLIQLSEAQSRSPLDVIEQLVADNDWVFDRPSDEEIAVQVPGRWCDYNLYFAWNEPADAMHFTLAFDIRVPDRKRSVVNELLALANEKIWMVISSSGTRKVCSPIATRCRSAGARARRCSRSRI